MDFKKTDFDVLPYSVDGTPDYIEAYPALNKYPEFNKKTRAKLPCDFNMIFKYIVLFYTPRTPLMQITDVSERKEAAANLAGLDTEKLFDNDEVNELIIRYLRIVKNYKWSKLLLWTEGFWNQGRKLLSGKTETGERTEKLLSTIDDLEIRIEKTLAEFLSNDPSEKLKTDVLQAIEEELLPSQTLKPEVIARRLSDNEDPLDGYTPYK